MTNQEFYAAVLPLELISEYDSAAEYCAKNGTAGCEGTPLPPLLSANVLHFINIDIEAFQSRVRDFAYAISMERNVSKFGI